MRSHTMMLMFAFVTAILVLPGGAWGASTENVLYTFQGGSDCAPEGSLIFDPAGNLYGTTYGGGSAAGEVYELARSGSGWMKTTLYTFAGGSDGAQPVTGLVRDEAGNLYGTTAKGGAGGYGVVYELSPNGSGWTESVLYTFTGGSDGATPHSGLIFDQAGNLYGATWQGGAGSNGVVFKLTRGSSGWTESVLHAFTGGNDGGWPQGNLLFDPAGNLYGTTLYDGVGGVGTVFKLTPSAGGWTKTTLYNFTSDGNDGYMPEAGLTRDRSGVLYGTASAGGSGFGGVVFELRPYPSVPPTALAGWEETPIYSFTGSDGNEPDTPLVFDQAGNLYGTTLVGGNGWGVVYELTPGSSGWTESVLYAFTDGADGGVPQATVTLDSTGNLYGTTAGGGSGCGVVYRITPQR